MDASQAFSTQALAERALDHRLDPAAAAPIAVAFSGGSDSLAALVLAKAWADRVGRKVVALTVDHNLNPSSAQWTLNAGRTARHLGVHWIGLSWVGDKPSTGLPAAARYARHRLLANAVRDASASVLLIGHTADDSAESDVIRTDTPGHGYLRDWSPSPVWPEGRDVFVLRPLLKLRRNDLRDWLRGQGLSWFNDPSNVDLRYARSRARASLAEAGAGECSPAQDMHANISILLADMTATHDGRLIWSRAAFMGMTDTQRRRIVGSALLCASGGATPPRGVSLDRLISQLTHSGACAATLCGARIIVNDETITFAREAGDGRRGGVKRSALNLTMGQTEIFDGRFEVAASVPDLCVRHLAGAIARLQPEAAQAVRRLPSHARGALPALVHAQGAVSLPAPFGDGPGEARSLVGRRMVQACGAIRCEADINA